MRQRLHLQDIPAPLPERIISHISLRAPLQHRTAITLTIGGTRIRIINSAQPHRNTLQERMGRRPRCMAIRRTHSRSISRILRTRTAHTRLTRTLPPPPLSLVLSLVLSLLARLPRSRLELHSSSPIQVPGSPRLRPANKVAGRRVMSQGRRRRQSRPRHRRYLPCHRRLRPRLRRRDRRVSRWSQ